MANFVFVCFDNVTVADAAVTNHLARSGADTVSTVDALNVQWHGFVYEVAEKSSTRMRTVQAALTSLARWHLARAVYTGAKLSPCMFELGTGWNEQRWNTLPTQSASATQLVTPVFTGYAISNQLQIEEANASTLSLRLSTYDAFAYQVNEVLVYAKIHNDSAYKGVVIPFASCCFPRWYHAPAAGSSSKQQFVMRLIIPLGMGVRVSENTAFKQTRYQDSVSVTDTLIIHRNIVRTHADAVSAFATVVGGAPVV